MMSSGLIKNGKREMPPHPDRRGDVTNGEFSTTCGKHPRLGTLGSCASCVQAAAAVDRQSRIAAEIRLLAREKSAREAAGWLKLEGGRQQATVGAPHG
jgi:hypothetical protein